MTSGQETLAKVLSVQGDEIIISNPVAVAPAQQGIGLVPATFTADPKENLVLNRHSIAMSALTDSSIKAKYIQATTGLAIPTEKKLILG